MRISAAEVKTLIESCSSFLPKTNQLGAYLLNVSASAKRASRGPSAASAARDASFTAIAGVSYSGSSLGYSGSSIGGADAIGLRYRASTASSSSGSVELSLAAGGGLALEPDAMSVIRESDEQDDDGSGGAAHEDSQTDDTGDETEEEALNGTLLVTVHKLTGLTAPITAYFEIEVDSFGQFTNSKKTGTIEKSSTPQWNQVDGCTVLPNGYSILLGSCRLRVISLVLCRSSSCLWTTRARCVSCATRRAKFVATCNCSASALCRSTARS